MKSFFLAATIAAALAATSNGQALKAEMQPNPSAMNSAQASWSVTADGSPLLSWIEASPKEGLYTLKYAVRKGGQWSAARTIAANRKFFRHPAELPEVITLPDGTLFAHWVENPGEEDDAEFLYVSTSHDGVQWSAPTLAHKDRSMVQHGLASVVASGDHEASVIWLEALHGEDAPVAMKRTVMSADGKMIKEESLDSDVCGCCPTSIVKTNKGLLIAYRDRTSEDIRDIATTRFENGKWTTSKILNADNWKINACPTNAAAAVAKGDAVAVSWFTGAGTTPRVQLAMSTDDGATFGKPILVSTGHSFGYTAITSDDQGGAFVSWLEQSPKGAKILVRQVTSAGVAGPVVQVAEGGRSTLGYPRILRAGGETWVSWSGGGGKVQTARLVK
jgi:BNR repeat-like domain